MKCPLSSDISNAGPSARKRQTDCEMSAASWFSGPLRSNRCKHPHFLCKGLGTSHHREQVRGLLLQRALPSMRCTACCIHVSLLPLSRPCSSMLAEALHSIADVLNQALLRIGVLKSLQAPTQEFPYGYLRDRFVWSLISAVGIFFLGAGVVNSLILIITAVLSSPHPLIHTYWPHSSPHGLTLPDWHPGASVIHGIHSLADDHHVEGLFWTYMGKRNLRPMGVNRSKPGTCSWEGLSGPW